MAPRWPNMAVRWFKMFPSSADMASRRPRQETSRERERESSRRQRERERERERKSEELGVRR